VDSSAVAVPDSLKVAGGEAKKEKKQKPKKEGRKTGTKLLLIDLAGNEQITIPYVKDYSLAEEGQRLLVHTTGTPDSTWMEGVYLYDCAAKSSRPLFTAEGEYKSLSLDKAGTQAAFLANLDTTDARIPPFGLFYWDGSESPATVLADTAADFLPDEWLISEYARPVFSDDGSRLFFGMAPPPILQDTSLLEEEIVNVEVWSYTDGRLHTNQKTMVDREKRRSYDVVYYSKEKRFVPLADEDMPEMSFAEKRNADVAIGYTEEPYLQLISWEGRSRRDVWLVDLKTGERKEIIKGLRGFPRLSPNAKFAYWYSDLDSAWFAYKVETGTLKQITTNEEVP
ncbi:MAG: hypothetical protein D6816_01110, partial [Bacteroidetes bacterium]